MVMVMEMVMVMVMMMMIEKVGVSQTCDTYTV